MKRQGPAGHRINPSGLDDLARFILTVVPEHYIFREGDWGNEIYVVQEGEVEISKTHGGRRDLARTGDFFGEAELLEGQPRAFSARATTNCRLVRLDFKTFRQIVHENPEIAIGMLRLILRRQRALDANESSALSSGTTSGGDSELGQAAPKDTGTAKPASPVPADDLPTARGIDSKPLKATEAGNRDPFKDFVPDEDFAPASADAEPRTLETIHELDEDALLPEPLRAVLVHVPSGKEYALPERAETLIGRAGRRSGRGPDIDFGGMDPQRTLSRRHATISRSHEGFQLTELVGAENGTFVNGERVPAGVPVELKDGDSIRFGYVKVVFRVR